MFYPCVKAGLTDHTRGPGFFTVIAGTCVLGSQLLIVAGRYQVAMVLWFLGAVTLGHRYVHVLNRGNFR